MGRGAISNVVVPAEIDQVLARYRSALKQIDQGGTAYKAGRLEAAQQELYRLSLPSSLGVAVLLLQELLQDCADAIFRGVLIGGTRPGMLVCFEGLVKMDRLERGVLEPLTRWGDPDAPPADPHQLRLWLETMATAAGDVSIVRTVGEAAEAALGGEVILLVDGFDLALKLGLTGWEQRGIEEPISESYIRGPRDGFVETLRTNTAQIRRRLQSPHLKVETYIVGRRTRTTVNLIYLKDVASPNVAAEIRRRLRSIDIDGVMDVGMLEEFLEDQPSSLFPQLNNTERPDRVVAALLAGQLAVLADGSPFALLAPATFWSFLHAGEDYYERFWIGTFLLWLRYLFLVVALTLPAFYVALTTFHAEMLPTALLLSISAAREGIPFPALTEILFMEVFFEVLREAGVRLPRPVGQAVSIVGALVIGEAAVRAGLVSAPVVITVAATGIASFTFPRFDLGIAVRLLRFPLILLAGLMGLFGITVGVTVILIHLCALRSFGVPYLQPLAPLTWTGLKDVLLRAPLWMMVERTPGMGSLNPRRLAWRFRAPRKRS
ncbi:MAG: spore germination protein [Bacillota bacterium]